jgi:hypothetical protein
MLILVKGPCSVSTEVQRSEGKSALTVIRPSAAAATSALALGAAESDNRSVPESSAPTEDTTMKTDKSVK